MNECYSSFYNNDRNLYEYSNDRLRGKLIVFGSLLDGGTLLLGHKGVEKYHIDGEGQLGGGYQRVEIDVGALQEDVVEGGWVGVGGGGSGGIMGQLVVGLAEGVGGLGWRWEGLAMAKTPEGEWGSGKGWGFGVGVGL